MVDAVDIQMVLQLLVLHGSGAGPLTYSAEDRDKCFVAFSKVLGNLKGRYLLTSRN